MQTERGQQHSIAQRVNRHTPHYASKDFVAKVAEKSPDNELYGDIQSIIGTGCYRGVNTYL